MVTTLLSHVGSCASLGVVHVEAEYAGTVELCLGLAILGGGIGGLALVNQGSERSGRTLLRIAAWCLIPFITLGLSMIGS